MAEFGVAGDGVEFQEQGEYGEAEEDDEAEEAEDEGMEDASFIVDDVNALPPPSPV